MKLTSYDGDLSYQTGSTALELPATFPVAVLSFEDSRGFVILLGIHLSKQHRYKCPCKERTYFCAHSSLLLSVCSTCSLSSVVIVSSKPLGEGIITGHSVLLPPITLANQIQWHISLWCCQLILAHTPVHEVRSLQQSLNVL